MVEILLKRPQQLSSLELSFREWIRFSHFPIRGEIQNSISFIYEGISNKSYIIPESINFWNQVLGQSNCKRWSSGISRIVNLMCWTPRTNAASNPSGYTLLDHDNSMILSSYKIQWGIIVKEEISMSADKINYSPSKLNTWHVMHQLQLIKLCEVLIHHLPLKSWLQQGMIEPVVAQEFPIENH